jgi:hypothetical protein
MRVLALTCLLAVAGIACAQNTATRKSSPNLKTFTSPDGTFQFAYPDLLIRCELRPQNGGEEYFWVQPECNSYHPACGDQPTPDEPVICIAYPRNQHTQSPAFEAAVVSVSETNVDEKQCIGELVGKSKTRQIGGVRFYFVEETDGGMNQARNSKGYVTFHNGKCYGIGITVATANAGTFDPPAKELTKLDWAEVYARLEQTRDSFRFLR